MTPCCASVMDIFAEAGFRIIGADEVLDDLRVVAGPLGAISPAAEHWPDIRRAAEVAKISGSLEIGQGAVSCAGLILAVEAQEGTDRMLARIPELAPEIRGTPDARRGVLVKRPKPQQEMRIDLPTIGVTTVEGAARAGLAGIAVEAGAALVVDREAVAAAADAAGHLHLRLHRGGHRVSHIFLVAAEDSGDAFGADVIDALRAADPAVQISGIGGERMRSRGAFSDVDMSGLAVIGLIEGLKAYDRVKQAVEDAADVIAKADPDSVVLIDSWGFMWRLARALKMRGARAKRIKLIGPQVWATRPGPRAGAGAMG